MSVDPASRGWNEHRHLLDVPGGWTVLVYSNTWADYGGGYQTGAWWKDPCGVIHLRGMLTRGTTAVVGETIATLPLGARPTAIEVWIGRGVVAGNYGDVRIDVAANGVMTWQGLAVTIQLVGLSGFTFRSS